MKELARVHRRIARMMPPVEDTTYLRLRMVYRYLAAAVTGRPVAHAD
jgi:hypothetical protein